MICTSLRYTFIVLGAFTATTPLIAQDTQTQRGEIVRLDEAAGKITVRPETRGTTATSQTGSTEEFAVKDGLVFNALKPGDEIAFTVETVNGQKRISKVTQQAK